VRRLRLIRSGHCAKTDGQPIPAVDRDDGHSQIDQFLFAEFPQRRSIDVIRYMIGAHQGYGFRPGQGGALARAEEGGSFQTATA
jgi:hypothetical protein